MVAIHQCLSNSRLYTVQVGERRVGGQVRDAQSFSAWNPNSGRWGERGDGPERETI